MYTTILVLHSWLRWAALVAGIGATIMAMRDSSGPSGSSKLDRWGMGLVTLLDIQLLLGLIMYLAVSPTMEAIRANFGGAMKDPVARFWAVEHIGGMMLGIGLVHTGRDGITLLDPARLEHELWIPGR